MNVTKEMVLDFLANWYRMMDSHAPLEEVLQSVAPDQFRMQIIDGPMIEGEAGFTEWYMEKISTSFDSLHMVHSIDVTVHGDTADAVILADWSGRNWVVPGVKSEAAAFRDKLLTKLCWDEGKGCLVFTEYLVRSAD